MGYSEDIIGANVKSIVNPFGIKITKLELSREAKLVTYSEEDLIDEFPKFCIPRDITVNYVHAYFNMEIETKIDNRAIKCLVEAEVRYLIDIHSGEVIVMTHKILETTLPQGVSWSDQIKNFVERYGLIVIAVIRALLERFM